MTHLSLSLLGPFQATLDGEPIAGFESAKVRALLAYLAAEAHQHPGGHSRRALAGLLWPNKPECAALANLRNALANLRTAIGDRDASPPYLQITRETVRFNLASDHWSDVAAFQALVETTDTDRPTHEQLKEAAALYRGDLLEGLFVRDSSLFEEWVLLLRERLHRQALEALGALAVYHEEREAYREAIACARRQVALEPWNESAHRQWMRALAASGRRGAALVQYDVCRQVLAEELGVEPEAETVTLYEQIRTGVLAPSRPPAGKAAAEPRPEAALPATVVPVPEGSPSRPPPPLGPDVLEGERREVTVVQVEVSGSTALTSRVDGDHWAAFVGQFLRAAASEIYRLGGKVDRYDAEGLVAIFGAQAAHEDDPERAVLAALAMQTAFQAQLAQRGQLAQLAERKTAWDTPGDPGLRVGVHTGETIVTFVEGNRGRGRSAVVGDALSLASPVLANVPPGEVRVSEVTRGLVEPLFEWGTGEKSHRPLRHKALWSKGRGIAGLESPLVGRDAELCALREAVARLRDGIGGIVTVVGEAGIGKSRLVSEIRELALGADISSGDKRSANPASPNLQFLQWVEGRCLSYATTGAYQLWLDVLRGLLGLAADTAPLVAGGALREQVHALCADDAQDVYPFVARMLSLPLTGEAEEKLHDLDAKGLQVLTFRAVETLVECAAQRGPLVLAFEDLHWADPTSLALLDHLLPLTDRVPLLVICVFRPEKDHGCWRLKEIADRFYGHRHTGLWLDPLTEQETAALIGHLLHPLPGLREDLPGTLRAHILEHAEGNPFYVEEILRSLIDCVAISSAADGGAGIVSDGTTCRWVATRDTADIPIPATLRGVLVSRIDRLPRGARQVLQLASVVGRTFGYRVLAAICSPLPRQEEERASRRSIERPGQGKAFDAHLVALQRAQMVREQSRVPEATYVFKHQLTLEAAYDSLPQRKRRVLHRRAAEALEQLFPERIEEQPGLLAHHWERAGEVERAIPYLQRAGERAAAQFANADAVAYLSRAIELVPEGDLSTRYDLLLAREGVYDVQGAREDQSRDLAALEALADALVDDGHPAAKRRAEVAARQARYAITVGDFSQAIQAAQKAVRLAQAAQDIAGEASGYLQWGRALRGRSEYQAAGSRLEQALALARSGTMPRVAAASLRGLGLVHLSQDNYSQARSRFEQALRIYRQIGHRRGESTLLRDLGSVYMYLGDYRTAREHNTRALQICRQIGDRPEEGWTLLILGAITTAQGDYAAGMDNYEGALRILNEIDDRQGEGVARLNLGVAYSHQGDYRKAEECYERAVRAFVEIGDRAMTSVGWVYLGLLAHLTGENESARAKIQRALRITLELDDLACQGHALTVLGHALSSLGDLTQAAADYERALTLLRESGQHYLIVEPLAGLARVALAREDRTQALAYAQEILGHLESHPGLEGADEPLRVYLTCYRVLRADGDPRAQQILHTAYRLLQERAAGIDDRALRCSYLDNVAAHREIVAAWLEASHR